MSGDSSKAHQRLTWLMHGLNGHGCGQVAEEDLKRVASATGGAVQSTVNNLDPKVLGTCAQFEEVQVSLNSSGGPCMQRLPIDCRSWPGQLVFCLFCMMPAVRGWSCFGRILCCKVKAAHRGCWQDVRLGDGAQVGAERFNLFKGCPKAKTATMVLRGGSDQFIDEAERSLHDAIMIVRRAIKNASVVAGGGAIDMDISR